MKMRLKIFMAVLAVFFLAAGNAMAIPTVNCTVADNVITFNIINDLDGYNIYGFGIGPASLSVDESWVLPSGVSYTTPNGNDYFSVYPNVDSVTGVKITYLSVPDVLSYVVYILGPNHYEGDGAITLKTSSQEGTYGYYQYKFIGTMDTTSVPEPISLIMLGLGLLGIAGLKKKLQK